MVWVRRVHGWPLTRSCAFTTIEHDAAPLCPLARPCYARSPPPLAARTHAPGPRQRVPVAVGSVVRPRLLRVRHQLPRQRPPPDRQQLRLQAVGPGAQVPAKTGGWERWGGRREGGAVQAGEEEGPGVQSRVGPADRVVKGDGVGSWAEGGWAEGCSEMMVMV